MATVMLCGVDLFIRGKLEALLPEHRFMTTDGIDPPDLVIADVARVDPEDVADSYPEVPLLGFTNHKDTAGLRRKPLMKVLPHHLGSAPRTPPASTRSSPNRRCSSAHAN